ncbi:MAG: protein kinase [Myxococcales bacterium]|nr:protein kinase [Myxococcales bacterium]MCB9581468.1 protein kinase [Polyangiaceae bacterium]
MAQQQQRYRVIEKIASGGMAEVFRAESAGLEGFKKTVAIKRVLPHLAEKKQFMGMFLDEARLSAHLSHSNCVQVFDIGVGDDTFFIVMEYVDGADLKAIIEYSRKHSQAIPPGVACLICVRICEGLAYAHELMDAKGNNLHIVHRDMSPPNVLITRHGEVKIVDFGLAKANSQLEKSEPGIIKGKFSYLSPEAALGQPVDGRTDIFAVGIILWELLAGRRLFQGETDLETVRQVQSARVPPIRQLNPAVSPDLEAVIAKSLAQDPTARYQSARDLGRDLNAVLFGLGSPVSSFDIAALVEPVVKKRQTDAARKANKKSIIGSLIEQALFEFTSLQEGSEDRSSADIGSAPLNLGMDWAEDLGLGSSVQNPVPSEQGFELGNLAALEDENMRQEHYPSAPASAPVSVPHPIPQSEPHPMPASAPGQQLPPPISQGELPQKKGGKGGIIALLLVLLLVAGAVGAYFAGLIPPGIIPENLLPPR